MNSRDRLLATMRLETPDRVPCSPLVGTQVAANMPFSEWTSLLHGTDLTMKVLILEDLEIFGGQQYIDGITVTENGKGLLYQFETPAGVLRSRRIVRSATVWQSEHFLKQRADVTKVLSIPYQRPHFNADPYFEWTERVGDEGLVSLEVPSAFRFCLSFFGPMPLYVMIADDPELIEMLVATMNERLAVYIEDCCKKGIRYFWMGGSEHCGPGVVNPKLFRRLVTPYDKQIVEIIHRHGGIVNYHTHGKLKAILDDITEIGVDVMSPIESGTRGDVSLAEVKARIGHRMCLKGNLDDMAFLALASKAEVRAAARACIDQAAASGGYILSGTDADVYDPRWVQNFLVAAQVAEAHRY